MTEQERDRRQDMEDMTETSEKMTSAEFEELYNRAVSRVWGHERQAVPERLEAMIRTLVREELGRMFWGDSNGQKKN
jgi:hypothetical protein